VGSESFSRDRLELKGLEPHRKRGQWGGGGGGCPFFRSADFGEERIVKRVDKKVEGVAHCRGC